MTCGAIPGIPEEASQRLVETLAVHSGVAQIWLYGSRAMGRERVGSDIDLSLEGIELTHRDLLLLMDQVDDLLLAWKVDLSIRHQLPAELEAHLQRAGIPLIKGSNADPP
ncbi:MAG: nucleotidyltransferase domain-containing protein [Synechococcus sp. WH 8007]|nr:nucleotidyltransferase domain-containing protein [Synechococcus sp. WH 8007]